MDSIANAWKYLIATGAGTGAVYILRWYWWRINAWSEISAMICAAVTSFLLQDVFGFDTNDPIAFAHMILITVAVTTAVWLAATFLTAPRKRRHAHQILPPRAAFAIRLETHHAAGTGRSVSHDLAWNLFDWLCGCALVYGTLFGIGKIILQEPATGAAFLVVAIVAAIAIYWDLARRGWTSVMQ